MSRRGPPRDPMQPYIETVESSAQSENLVESSDAEGSSAQWNALRFHSESPGSRVFPSAVVNGEELYVFGGHDGADSSRLRHEEFEPEQKQPDQPL